MCSAHRPPQHTLWSRSAHTAERLHRRTAPPIRSGEDLGLRPCRDIPPVRREHGCAGMSMTPSPIMPRSSSMSAVGTSQSQTWKARMRRSRPARADAHRPGSRPTTRGRRRWRPRRRPLLSGSSTSHKSSASPSVVRQDRSAAYIGCSGSSASGTPSCRASSSDAPQVRRGSALRAASMSREPARQPADDHDEDRRPVQRRGVPERATVVDDRGRSRPRGIFGRESGGAAIAADR